MSSASVKILNPNTQSNITDMHNNLTIYYSHPIKTYNSAVNEFLRTGDVKILKPFKRPFKDANGKLHYFEIDPDKLYEIAEQQEEPEFWEIYKI